MFTPIHEVLPTQPPHFEKSGFTPFRSRMNAVMIRSSRAFCSTHQIKIMKLKLSKSIAAASLIALASLIHAAPAAQDAKLDSNPDMQKLESIIADWPPMAQLGVRQTIKQHGAPQGVTAEALIWTEVAPFESIKVTKQVDHHDFPMPHMDYMEHTISYLVPAEKAAELAAFDGSLTYDRTRGLMSARCDLQVHNILTLNLAHDIIEGKKTAAEAREAFGKIVGEDNAGMNPAYTAKLQFETKKAAGYTDLATIPGAPARAAELENPETDGDGAVLASLIAVDIDLVVAAKTAAMMDVTSPVKEFSEMLQKDHAENAAATMKLAEKTGIKPVITEEIGKSRMEAAGNLADIVAKADGDFGHLYVDAMVKGHQKNLDEIDNKLMKNASNEEVKSHLAATRAAIAKHLERAKEIQSGLKGKSASSTD